MPNPLINTMSNGVGNNFSSACTNRFPINYQNNYQGFRSVGFPGQSSGPQTNVIWINDLTEVYSYPFTNDSHLLFGDQKNSTFYYRIVDKNGSLVQVSRLPFSIEVIFPVQNQQSQQPSKEQVKESDQKPSPENHVIGKEEYEQLLGMVKDLSEKFDKFDKALLS